MADFFFANRNLRQERNGADAEENQQEQKAPEPE
jgi:hypothetical protein